MAGQVVHQQQVALQRGALGRHLRANVLGVAHHRPVARTFDAHLVDLSFEYLDQQLAVFQALLRHIGPRQEEAGLTVALGDGLGHRVHLGKGHAVAFQALGQGREGGRRIAVGALDNYLAHQETGVVPGTGLHFPWRLLFLDHGIGQLQRAGHARWRSPDTIRPGDFHSTGVELATGAGADRAAAKGQAGKGN
ncbi:hypothetical protein FQZ97_784820 [compost metagenome]